MSRCRDGTHRAFPLPVLRFAEAMAALVRWVTGADFTRCPRWPAGSPAVRGHLRAGRPPGPRAGHLLSPPLGVRLAIGPAPRRMWRDGGVRPPRFSPVPPGSSVLPTSPLLTLTPLRYHPTSRSQASSPDLSDRIQSP